ncbi:hypothetical protein [Novipirellula aureliae]|uniref:hypothetical protein n=1 Tax=Novipirellula aureliae TaxID=2527966 RepID=UPI0011B5294F|nr:hypothetical protein [Novipirellula aureliae]
MAEKNRAPSCGICCCAKDSHSEEEDQGIPEHLAPAAAPKKSSVILIWKAAECRGIELVWTLLSHAFVVLDNQGDRLFPHRLQQWIRLFDENQTCRSDSPEPPVP